MSVPAAGSNQRRTVFGALDYASGILLWTMPEQKNGAAFADFLDQLAQRWPDEPIVLVLDNVSYHRSPVVRTWWAQQQGRIIPFWLPVYTPNLNLIERVWRFLKQKLVCHRFWSAPKELQQAAATLLDRLVARFHTKDPPSIRLIA